MIKNLKELSQVLAAVGILISTSQEEKILEAIETLSTPPPDPQEFSFYFPCQVVEKTKDSLKGEDPFSSHIPSTQKIHYPIEEDLYGEAKEEEMQHYLEMDLEYHDYIEHRFQTTTPVRHHSLLKKFLVLYHLQLLVFHAHIHFQVYMLNLSMNISLYPIHTWLHWKYSFT
jgi:hypothetical protein